MRASRSRFKTTVIVETTVIAKTSVMIKTTDIRIKNAIVSAKRGEAPIGGCIFEGGAGTS